MGELEYMIPQHKIDRLTKNELYVFCYVFRDLLIDKKRIGDAEVPLYRLKWLRLRPTVAKLNEAKKLMFDRHKNLIDSLITKLITN
jgi:hypothetical protein